MPILAGSVAAHLHALGAEPASSLARSPPKLAHVTTSSRRIKMTPTGFEPVLHA